MSQGAAVQEEYRPLTEREREILEFLLSVEVDGIAQLREQVPHALAARWSCGCASFDLIVDKSNAPRSRITKSPLSESSTKDAGGDPNRYFDLLLWIDDGWLSGVELVDYVEHHGAQSPQEIPSAETFEPPQLVQAGSQP